MAYLYLRKSGRAEIREAHTTPRGPRSFTLASFQGPLTEEILERAEAAANRPFDRTAIRERARELEIPIARPSADAAAHALTARLRSGSRLDPVLVTILREQLAGIEARPVGDDVSDVVEWIGASEFERGRALRDVLRLYDTIVRSREPVIEVAAPRFPRFQVRPGVPGRRAS